MDGRQLPSLVLANATTRLALPFFESSPDVLYILGLFGKKATMLTITIDDSELKHLLNELQRKLSDLTL